MGIKIAIPSYQRAFEQLTIDYLESIGFPMENVFVFVQTKEDLQNYQAKGYHNRVNKLIYKPAKNVAQNRNNILDYFSNGDFIIQLDDDIKAFCFLNNKSLVDVTDGKELMSFFKHGFKKAIQFNTKLWGIYPVANHFFMSNKIATWSLIIGKCFGVINSEMRFDTRFTLKSDYEFTCRVLKQYGKVVRFNFVTTNSKTYSKGGCEVFRNEIKDKECYELFLKEHGGLIKPNPKRENEILLKRKKR